MTRFSYYQQRVFLDSSRGEKAWKVAEDLVASQMLCSHWQILDRNVRGKGYELDLVVRRGETLALVEVKQRRELPRSPVEVSELLPPRKQQALLRGFEKWRHQKGWATVGVWRVDLAIVQLFAVEDIPATIRYYPNCFEAFEA